MLASTSRLRSSTEIREVIRKGRRASADGLTLHVRQLDSRTDLVAAAAFVVPRKVGNAVVRNTITRRLRHLMRERITGLPVGGAVVIRVSPEAATKSFTELATGLDRCFTKAGLTQAVKSTP